MMKRNSAKSYLFLVASFCIHFLFLIVLVFIDESAFLAELNKRLDHQVVDKTKDVVTQIELVDLKENMKQIVEQSDKSVNEEEPTEAKFLSAKNQNVKKETKANRSGKFNNGSGSGVKSPPPAKQQAATKPQKQSVAQESKPVTKGAAPASTSVIPVKNLGLNGLPIAASAQQALQNQNNNNEAAAKSKNAKAVPARRAMAAAPPSADGSGVSQTDDFLKDIEDGAQTLLRTREFKYYSFYKRVKSQLRSHWNPMIRQRVSFLHSTGRKLASDTHSATSVRVIINDKGYLERVELLKTSGVKDLDAAAINAFREAAPFPHPPKGMVEKDGKIRIFWDFVLET